MTPLIRGFRRSVAITLVISAAFSIFVDSAIAAQDPAKGVAAFKFPDGYMRAPLTDFTGVMMLDPKRPAGMIVIYHNDRETTEALSKRLLDFILPMFFHEKGTMEPGITWNTKPLVSHPGDGDGKATINTYSAADQEVQVAIYERTGGVRPFLYGYFGMRHKVGKGDDARFVDDQGNGVKAFDKLWKSLPK